MGESVVREVAQGLEVRTMQPFYKPFIVCMSLGLFGCVEGSFWAPRCFLQRSILSRTLDTIVSQGILCVRESQQFRTLLRHLSPQGVGS